MAETTINCGICSARNNYKPAVIYCHDCSEQLCETCQEHHDSFKVTRNHHTIYTADYKKLPGEILQTIDICTEHEKKYVVYCKNHIQPCCRICAVAYHKKCKDLAKLKDVVQNFKSSRAPLGLEASLKESIEYLAKLKTDRENNLKTIAEDCKTALDEIENIRRKINKYLDNLQDNIKAKLKYNEEKTRNEISHSLTSLQKEETFIGENLQTLTNVRKYASDLQAFLYFSKLENQVHAMETRLLELSLDTINIYVEFEPALNKFTDEIKRYGEVKISALPSSLVLCKKREGEDRLIISRPKIKQIEDINLTVVKTIDNIGILCQGCCILTDGRIAFTNHLSNVIRIFDSKGREEVSIKTSGYPFDVALVNDTTLAVSYPNSGIQLIDINIRKVTKSLIKALGIHGVTAHGEDHLIYCVKGIGVRMVRISEGTISDIHDIVKENLPKDSYVTSFGETVIHTNSQTNNVTCHNISGKKVWSFKDERVLRGPRGIATDRNGNSYIAGLNNVVIISTDGQKHKEVKCELEYIYSLDYDKVNDKLLVAHLNKAVLMEQN